MKKLLPLLCLLLLFTAARAEGFELRFPSFDGGGMEYFAVVADDSVLDVGSFRDYGEQKVEEITGAAYDAVFAFEALAPGKTRVTVYGQSPIMPEERWEYLFTVDEGLQITCAPLQAYFSLSRAGYNAPCAYELLATAEEALLLYDGWGEKGEMTLPQATCVALVELLIRYDVAAWDGFYQSDDGVLDGEFFFLELALADGTRVSASGNNAFPPAYREFTNELDALLLPGIIK